VVCHDDISLDPARCALRIGFRLFAGKLSLSALSLKDDGRAGVSEKESEGIDFDGKFN
jgi:hypothetical protein